MGKSYFFFGESNAESRPALPDVYWDGKPEHGLADDPITGKPRVFGSRAEKAQYLRDHNLQEAGDRQGGSPLTPRPMEVSDFGQAPVDRESALKALHHVRQMGQDVRRQAYLKIVKEGRRS